MSYLTKWLKFQEQEMNKTLAKKIKEVLSKPKSYHTVGIDMLQPQIDLHAELDLLIKEREEITNRTKQ